MNRRILFAVPIIIILVYTTGCQGKKTSTYQSSEYQIWYDKPAADWNEALPIGNGRLGAMIFGWIKPEQLTDE